MLGANIGLIVLAAISVLILAAILYKETVLDFIKGNLGLFILLLLFLTLLAVSFHVFHEAASNALSKDFLAWLEQKAGEVLASIMTVIVGAVTTNRRSSDAKNGTNGNGNGSPEPVLAPAPAPTEPVTLPGATH